jgi:hypothetical protein
MRILFFIPLLLALVYACKSKQDEYFYTENKVKFKILDLSSDEQKIQLGDYVRLNISISDSNDEIYPLDSGNIILFKMYNESCKGGLYEGLKQLNKGDSAVFFMRASNFFKCQNEIVPTFFIEEETIKINLRVLDVSSELAKLKEFKELLQIDSLVIRVNETLNEFYTKADTVVKYENLYIAIQDSCNGKRIEKGEKVKMVHQSFMMNGKKIENSTLEEPFELIAGQQDQVIEGIRIAIGYLCYGQKARLLIPFDKSFTESFRYKLGINKEPIICEIEILEKD